MFYVLESREAILKLFPKQAIGAEIGVDHGEFSEQILRVAEPQQLHLIDPWSHHEFGQDVLASARMLSEMSQTLTSNAPLFDAPPDNSDGNRIFEAVTARFALTSNVHLHRQYSYKAVQEFPDQYFDFVYVDGDHSYEFVLRDLHDYSRKLKRGGLLFGHDFFENDYANKLNYGVIDAVNSFVKRTNFVLFMLTWEPFPTFCLTNDFNGFAGQFLRNCFDSEMKFIELPDAIVFNFRDKQYVRPSGVPRRIPSFF
jgi:hypothetical protein